MGNLAILALRVVIAIAFAGSVLVQCLLTPLMWQDMDDARPEVRVPLIVIFVLVIVCMQVTAVCIWRLLTMVRRGTVFSPAAFRFVDIIVGAILAASALTFGVAVVAAISNRTTPGDEVAPGVVGLICGLSLVIAGVALVVMVQRALLAQAVARDDEARSLQSELDEVI
ncbi:DUF2975 domain-containing protein [Nocardioides sp.]|uniref:DUF2975 domain-containing protein n=1 Tax=Nocardioides sp. TaxID=35761 RepID=UPI001A2800BC|nr:DUF2975 domain-containing protein [Nocardioides sp.]MBJ7355859.1 DUF2975 domain-containing protein [Nocardioides sp.]